MWQAALVLGWVVVASSAAIGWRRRTLRERAWQRLAQSDTKPEVIAAAPRSARRMSRRWIWVPWAVAAIVAIAVWFVTGWALQYIAAIALLVGLIGGQAEAFLAGQRIARLLATPQVVVIEPALDSTLNDARKQAVVNQLAQFNISDAESRVTIQRPIAEGMYGVESPRIALGYLSAGAGAGQGNQRGSVGGMGQGGFGSGSGGGFGGGGYF